MPTWARLLLAWGLAAGAILAVVWGGTWDDRDDDAGVAQLDDKLEREDQDDEAECTGDHGCPALVHVHGCWDDEGDCTEPEWHR